jgi:hypothetical protein
MVIAVNSADRNCSYDSYSGKSIWLKQVWLCGSRVLWPKSRTIVNFVVPGWLGRLIELDTLHSFQFFKAVEWHFRRSCGKLKQFCSLFFIERSYRTPKPLYLRRWCIIIGVATINNVLIWRVTLNELSNLQCQYREDPIWAIQVLVR